MSDDLNIRVDYDSIEYWRACEIQQLKLPYCQQCGAFLHFPRTRCPECWSTKLDWRELSGPWSLFTFVATPNAKFQTMGLTELLSQPGLRIPAPILCEDSRHLHVGQWMELTWVDVGNQMAPAFVPGQG